MDVAKSMRTKLIIARPDSDYKSLLCKITSSTPRQIYIVDENYKLLGIVTSLDLLKEVMPSYMNADLARSLTDGADLLQKQVEKVKDKCASEIMTTKIKFLRPEDQLFEANALIAETGFNTLPVLDEDGKILGEISRRDIMIRLINNCTDFNHNDETLVDLSLL
ncbi:MAG: CBS domain-containing protein [Desulfuromusa sp.]|nr:CBS domain-containing protein [Desulfuromusa sp.]